jgi:hypothetical protein
MIIQALENYARSLGPWMSSYQRATADFTRFSNQQTELAIETNRFLTDRLCAFAQYGGNVDSLAQKLEELTGKYTAVYADRVKEMSSVWADMLREDRNVDELTAGVVEPLAEQQGGVQSSSKRRAQEKRGEAH